MTETEVFAKLAKLKESKAELSEAIKQRNDNPDSFDARNIVSEKYIKIQAIKESLKQMIEEL